MVSHGEHRSLVAGLSVKDLFRLTEGPINSPGRSETGLTSVFAKSREEKSETAHLTEITHCPQFVFLGILG